jgi:hypothetical protein
LLPNAPQWRKDRFLFSQFAQSVLMPRAAQVDVEQGVGGEDLLNPQVNLKNFPQHSHVVNVQAASVERAVLKAL